MSYGSDIYSASSYRKIFGDSTLYSASPSRLSSSRSGFKSATRTSIPSTYKRTTRSAFPSSSLTLESFDFTQSTALNNEFKITRTNEKEQMQGLNDRFAMFIEKVRNLEQHNKVLEAELVTLRQRQTEPSRLAELYQQEIRELRSQLEELNAEKNQMMFERDNMEEGLQKLQEKFEEEMRMREEAEQTLRAFKKDVDNATMVRLDLEKKVESLLDEINFIRNVHEEEVTELMNMIQASQVSVEMEVAKPDLTSALKEIRGQYEVMANKNLQSAEEWYKTKFADLSEQANKSNEVIRASREELNEFRRQLQSKTIEIESLKGTNESLERQIHEMEDRLNAEVMGYQDTVGQLENHKSTTPFLTTFSLFTFSFIINLRKLLEGEETRISTGITYPTPASVSSYSYLSRMYSSTSASGKKEVKDDDDKHQQSSKPGKGSSQSDDSKTSDKINSGDVNPTNQKN
ncbi:alpha-internexin-like [Sinocyclocheilus grahami]|uniref:alpha-internexin-like n=1 Tax=Sinocyclocheilus grahami TaxID=75366 RepID=UPI0007AD5E43|nr:PREDICTED: alpha-internexin-like [Sinocyclocheilus grahami]